MADAEAFFELRGAAVMHEADRSPGSRPRDPGRRGYGDELSNVSCRRSQVGGTPSAPSLRVRSGEGADRGEWIETSVAAW